MTLDDAIEYYSKIAESLRKQVRIEDNDYMDKVDEVYTCEQLAEWLNELKLLRERIDAQPEQRWIPVTDHLPDEDVPVLVTDDAGGMATVGIDSCGRYEDTGERFWYTSQNVTAWMYTVEPYRGEQE